MKRWKLSWDALLVMSIVIVAGVCSQTQQAALAKDETQEEGRVVQIAPDAEDVQAIEEEVIEEPTYWIGIRGRGVQSPVLRTQLQLAEDMGVVVEGVIKESPAEKAGLRKHDIILRANGNAVHGMEVLQQQVRENGEKPIELKVIRLGKEETVVVVPEELPQDFAASNANPRQEFRGRFGGDPPDALRQFMEQLQREGRMQFDFNKGLEELLPRGLGGFERGAIQGQELSPQEKELSDRLERMEQELRKLQERMLNEIPTN